jgi:putative nucleotidyltransferase with HDIG domain
MAVRHMERLGLLQVLLPELAALRGIPQRKSVPGDALDHSLLTADALDVADPILRLAGLLHDLGKATTGADGHFIGHESVGAELAATIGERLRLSRHEIARVSELVRHHMFDYRSDWTDAAVRRFIGRVGRDRLVDLLALRRADDAASGVRETVAAGTVELERRMDRELAGSPLGTHDLALDGADLVRLLEIPPGPEIGRLLRLLTDAVLEDPALNTPARLAALARVAHSRE